MADDTPGPDPVIAEHRQQQFDRMQQAREAGASWDQIYSSWGKLDQQLRAAGATDAQVNRAFGYNDSASLVASFRESTEQHVAATKPTSFVEGLWSGFSHSSLGALLGVTPDPNEMVGRTAKVAAGVTEGVSDLPASFVGALGGEVAGAVGGGFVPGAGETGASEAVGGWLGAGAGATALPQFIKSTRDRYAQAVNSGQVKGPRDFVNIGGQVLADTGKAAVVGLATAGAGRIVSPLLRKWGAGAATHFVGTTAAEAATMVTAQAAMEKRLPTWEDVIDASVTIGAFHAAHAIGAPGARSIRDRVWQRFTDTGEMPHEQEDRASADPVYRSPFFGEPDAHVPPGSSRTQVREPDEPGFVNGQMTDPRTGRPQVFETQRQAALHLAAAGQGHLEIATNPDGDGFVVKQNDLAVRTAREQAASSPEAAAPQRLTEVKRDADGTIHYAYQPPDGGKPFPIKVGVDEQGLDEDGNPKVVAEVAANQFGTDANALGPGETRRVMDELKTLHPEITHFGGWRTSGAGPGRVQEFKYVPRWPGARAPRDTYIIPRAAGDFDHALKWIMDAEGGLTTDTGGVTKYGISQKAHPGVNIKGLSKEDASEIYHREYWRAIDADALPPNMRLAAFDSAVNEGVGQTKTWLRQSGGDLQAFMRLRIEKYAKLARDPKYADYAEGWANRMEHLGVTKEAANIIRGGPDRTNVELSPEDRTALGLGGGGDGEEPPEEPPANGPEEPAGDPWEHVMGRTADPQDSDRWGNTLGGFSRIYGELFDPMHPVRRMVDAAAKGDALDDAHNPEFLFRLAENSGEVAKWAASKQMLDIDGKVTGPALEDIVTGKSVGQKFDIPTQKRFLDGYARARHALMLEDQGKKSGVDPEAARAVVAEGDGQFSEAFQHLVDYRNTSLRWLAGTALHHDDVEKLIKKNTASVPGYRRMDDGSYQPTSTGKPGIWNPVKEAKGSERQFEPLLKSLLQETFLRHQIAWNARALAATADVAVESGQATQRRPVNFNVLDAMDKLAEKGIDDDILSSLARATGTNIRSDEVPVLRDGKLYAVKFDDPEITKVLRGYDQKARGTITKIIGTITSLPRNLQTRWNPLFPVRLLTYDLPWQAITNPDSKGPLSSFFVGLGHMASDPEGYQEWLRSGAADHIFSAVSNDKWIQRVLKGHEEQSLAANAWNAAKAPTELLTAWTRFLSTPMRYGRYAKGIQQGESPIRATVASTEAAFHRPGYGGPFGKAWNVLVPYTTAHLNGMEKSVRALFGIGRTVTGAKYSASRTLIRGALLLTLPAIAQWFAYKDEEWYKAMPDYQKNNAWFFVPPTNGSPPIPVAAPPILSAVFIGLPRMLMERYHADNPHAFDDFWSSMGDSLLPPGGLTAASILTPVVEHTANYSFHKSRPLVSDGMIKGVQPAEQFTEYSSQAAKDMARQLSDTPLVHPDLSPAVIDNYIGFWGGPAGTALVHGIDAAVATPPHTARPETTVWDWPGVVSWTSRYPSASAAPIGQFYDTVTQMVQEHGSLVKTIRENDFGRFKEIVDKGGPTAAAYSQIDLGKNAPPNVDLSPYFDYLAKAAGGANYGDLTLVHQAAAALQNAHQYTLQVEEDARMTAHDKRQILDTVNAQMQKISERGNEAADRAHMGVSHAGSSAHAPVPDSITFTPPGE